MHDFSIHGDGFTRQHSVRRLYGAIILLLSVMAAGTIGYHVIEQWSFLDSLYMAVTTMTTIGFREDVGGTLSTNGRIFTICLALLGVGAAAYSLTTLATVLVGGELSRLIKGRQMMRDIKTLKDHIVLCGCGRTGSCALRELQAGGETVLVIERDQQICDELAGKGVPVMCADATLESVLEQTRLCKAKGLITAMPDDADNVFVTLTAREMAPDICIVARASYQHHESKLRRAGASRVVFVNEVAGRHMANILRMPDAIQFVDKLTGMYNREVGLNEVEITATCLWKDKTLREANVRATSALNVMAIRHTNGNLVINPGADTKIEEGDVLIVFGPHEQAGELNRQFGSTQ